MQKSEVAAEAKRQLLHGRFHAFPEQLEATRCSANVGSSYVLEPTWWLTSCRRCGDASSCRGSAVDVTSKVCLSFTLGMQGTLRQWMLALLWARLRSLPQGVLVIHFGSAASWRPCNVVRPHQGPVSHS